MKELAEKGGIQGKKTNHSARKTMVQTLCSANFPDSTIMQLSGHKSVSSLNHYKAPKLEQQRSLSNLLSKCDTGPSHQTSISAISQQADNRNQLATNQGLFSNATFTNCSVNVSINTSVPSASQVVTPLIVRPKRPRVIYDSDSETHCYGLKPSRCLAIHILKTL